MNFTISNLADSVGLLQFAVGSIAALVGGAVWRRLPHRLIWRFKGDEDVVVCLATSAQVDTGDYVRPATGIGQVKALAYAIPSILTGFGDGKRVETYLSEDMPAAALAKNIVVMGGIKNNAVTRRFIDRLYPKTGLKFADDGNTIMADGGLYKSESRKGVLHKDWGLIICAPNPFSEGRNRVVVLAGSSTYGTAAAARYFIDQRGIFKNLRKQSYWRLCEVEVLNGDIASITHCKTQVFQ